jgi:hypothetical protein
MNERWEKCHVEETKKTPQKESAEKTFKRYDHPNSLENSEATIIWLVVMAVGTIFKDNWIIWIVATIIWSRYITRHDR